MARIGYYHDAAASQARGLVPAAFALVPNGLDQVMLVRRADDGYSELAVGRVEVGDSAATAVVRKVAEEAGVAVKVTGLAGVYGDLGHVLAYPREQCIYQQFAVRFHVLALAHDASPDQDETSAAAWFAPEQAIQLVMHSAIRERVTNALVEPHPASFD